MNFLNYKIELQNNEKIKDEKLTEFIKEQIKFFGGKDLLGKVKIECKDSIIKVSCDKKHFTLVHCSLFFTGKYSNLKCQIYELE